MALPTLLPIQPCQPPCRALSVALSVPFPGLLLCAVKHSPGQPNFGEPPPRGLLSALPECLLRAPSYRLGLCCPRWPLHSLASCLLLWPGFCWLMGLRWSLETFSHLTWDQHHLRDRVFTAEYKGLQQ